MSGGDKKYEPHAQPLLTVLISKTLVAFDDAPSGYSIRRPEVRGCS